MKYIKEFQECPEYWENPKDICAAAEMRGISCICTALNDTNFGLRHCPFYKTAAQNRIEDRKTDRYIKANKGR